MFSMTDRCKVDNTIQLGKFLSLYVLGVFLDGKSARPDFQKRKTLETKNPGIKEKQIYACKAKITLLYKSNCFNFFLILKFF